MPDSVFSQFYHRLAGQSMPQIRPMYQVPDFNKSLANLMRAQIALMRTQRPAGGGRGGGAGRAPQEGDPRYGQYVDVPQGDGTTKPFWVWGKGDKARQVNAEKAIKAAQNNIIAKDEKLQADLAKLPTLSIEGQKEILEKIRKEALPRLTQATGMTAEELNKEILAKPAAEMAAREKAYENASSWDVFKSHLNDIGRNFYNTVAAMGESSAERLARGNAAKEARQKNIESNIYRDELHRREQEGRGNLGERLSMPGLTDLVGGALGYLAPGIAGSMVAGLPGAFFGGVLGGAGMAGGEALERVASDPNLKTEADKQAVIDKAYGLNMLVAGGIGAIPGPIGAARGIAAGMPLRQALTVGLPTASTRLRTLGQHVADAGILGGAFQAGTTAAYGTATGQDLSIMEGLPEAIAGGALFGLPFGAKAAAFNRKWINPRLPNPQMPESVARERAKHPFDTGPDDTSIYRIQRNTPATDTVLEPLPPYRTFTDNTTNPFVESFMSTPGNVYVRPSQPNVWMPAQGTYPSSVRTAILSRPEVTHLTPPVTARHPQNIWTPNQNIWSTQQPVTPHVQVASLAPPPPVTSIYSSHPAQVSPSNPRNIWTPNPNVRVIQNPVSPAVQVAPLSRVTGTRIKTAIATSQPVSSDTAPKEFSFKNLNTREKVKQAVKSFLDNDGTEDAVRVQMDTLKTKNFRYKAADEALNEYRAATEQGSGNGTITSLGGNGPDGKGKPVATDIQSDKSGAGDTATTLKSPPNHNDPALVVGDTATEKRGYAGAKTPDTGTPETLAGTPANEKPVRTPSPDGKRNPQPAATDSPESDKGSGGNKLEGGAGAGSAGDEAAAGAAAINKIQNLRLQAAAEQGVKVRRKKVAEAEQQKLLEDAPTPETKPEKPVAPIALGDAVKAAKPALKQVLPTLNTYDKELTKLVTTKSALEKLPHDKQIETADRIAGLKEEIKGTSADTPEVRQALETMRTFLVDKYNKETVAKTAEAQGFEQPRTSGITREQAESIMEELLPVFEQIEEHAKTSQKVKDLASSVTILPVQEVKEADFQTLREVAETKLKAEPEVLEKFDNLIDYKKSPEMTVKEAQKIVNTDGNKKAPC